MKKVMQMLAVLVTVATVIPAMGYEPLTDNQIAGILADHAQMNVVLTDANSDQIADVLARSLNQVGSSTLSDAGKSQTSALLYTRALLLSGEKAPQMVAALKGRIDVKLVPVLAASTAIAMGSSEGPVFDSLAMVADSTGVAALGDAAADPASVMTEDSVALIQQLVIEMRGVAAAVIPPPATAGMNLVPPHVVDAVTTPTPPPVADSYINQ
jgi:hypothetical protein